MAEIKPKFAIALEYDGEKAPQVTARGHHEVADQILQRAKDANIPIREDEELSMLLSQLNLGDHIPEALYVVTEILSSSYSIRDLKRDNF